MLLPDPKSPERLTCGPEAAPRIYLLRVPSVLERARFRREAAREGARRHSPFAMLDALARAILALTEAGPPREALLALVDEHRQSLLALSELGAPPGGDESAFRSELEAALGRCGETEARLAETARIVRDADPVFSGMESDNIGYMQIAGAVAARMFLEGWEGLPVPFARERSGVPEHALAAIPEGDLSRIGEFAEALMTLSEADRKNYLSPPSTPSGAAISTDTTATNGGAPSSASPGSASIRAI